GRAGERLLARERRQVVERAAEGAHLDTVVGDGGEPGRVVAPVLELTEPRHEDRARLARPDVADDAAHGSAPPSRAGRRGLRLALRRAPRRGLRLAARRDRKRTRL